MRSYLSASLAALAILGAAFYFLSLYKSRNQIPPEIEIMDELRAGGFVEIDGLDLVKSEAVHVGKDFGAGKNLILHFWASWCGPCVDEFPALLKVSKDLKADVEVVALSEDQSAADAQHFLETLDAAYEASGAPAPPSGTKSASDLSPLKILFGNQFHVLLDSDLRGAKVYGVDKLPETFIFNRERKLLQKFVGSADWLAPSTREILQHH